MSKPKQKFRVNTRKLYLEHHGSIPENTEIHHILPLRLGGSDSVENLVALSLEDHRQAHLDLFHKYGDFRDLCAYHMIGSNFSEATLIAASNGGTKAIKKFKETGFPENFGFQNIDPRVQRALAVEGGKIGGRKQVALKLGIHAQTKEERLIVASLGGKKSCETNGWRDSSTQSENGKRGGVKNKGFKWYNDGIREYKYTSIQQLTCSFELFLNTNTQFVRGRKK